jgi:hypothetical protein
MQTRAEAVDFLRAAGFQAAERDWALGRTVVVPADPKPSPPDGITAYGRMLCLIPNGQKWIVKELHRTPSRETEVDTLLEACRLAIELLSTTAP